MVMQLKGIDIKLESNEKYCNSKFKMLANLSIECGNTGQYKSVLFLLISMHFLQLDNNWFLLELSSSQKIGASGAISRGRVINLPGVLSGNLQQFKWYVLCLAY